MRQTLLNAQRLFERAGNHKRRGWRLSADALYRLAVLLDPELHMARRLRKQLRPLPPGIPDHLYAVTLGTTGTCNASCVHCPTGKVATAHSPRNPMEMSLFRSIIDGIHELGMPVACHVAFGLFGDGLVDPFVLERAAYMRRQLPEVPLAINTNGAAFNHAKHAELDRYATSIALHCESLTPEIFNDLMRPLRAERVFPKYEEILRTYPGKVRVSVPVSRKNLPELRPLRDWFIERGARDVAFETITSRCADDRSVFDALALAPGPIACPPDIMQNLIIDCDGTVLVCCNDFAREVPIGSVASDGFIEVLRDVRRKRIESQLEERRHDEIPICTKCFADIRTEDFPFDHQVAMQRRPAVIVPG